MIPSLNEPARVTPVCHEADLCVVGGSCTGLFAAVRAARLGLSVTVVEQQTLLGGMAVAAQVNEWHSTWDVGGSRRIIGGLTLEVVERLRHRGALDQLPKGGRTEFRFNSAEMAVELEELAASQRIRLFLGARCVAAARRDVGMVDAIVIEDRSGRRAIRARFFIDASGDGSLLAAVGLALVKPPMLQPVNLQAIVHGLGGLNPNLQWSAPLAEVLVAAGYPSANGRPWLMSVPGADALHNVYGARLQCADPADADDYTNALLNARRFHRLYMDAVRAGAGKERPLPSVVAWAQALGVRQSRHAMCLHPLSGEELLKGRAWPDVIAQGTYPVDIHAPNGVVLRYLDGREEIVERGGEVRWGRWRDADSPVPPFYCIPYRSLVPREAKNVLVAGRLLDADSEAFGAVRVMVNLNQTGEAAGTAAALALKSGIEVAAVDPARLRATMNSHGSLLLQVTAP